MSDYILWLEHLISQIELIQMNLVTQVCEKHNLISYHKYHSKSCLLSLYPKFGRKTLLWILDILSHHLFPSWMTILYSLRSSSSIHLPSVSHSITKDIFLLNYQYKNHFLFFSEPIKFPIFFPIRLKCLLTTKPNLSVLLLLSTTSALFAY